MVTAALTGVVDFREADPLDRRWWFRLRLALDYVEKAAIAAQHRLYYDYDLAILSRDAITDASNERFTKDAERQLFALINTWRPWEARNPKEAQQAQAAALSAAWAREFGNPEDPATKEAIAETVRLLRKMDVGARTPRHAPAIRR